MDPVLSLFVLTCFAAVTGIVFVAAHYVRTRIEWRRRLPSGLPSGLTSGLTSPAAPTPSPRSAFGAFVTDTFTEERFGVDSNLRQKLKHDLLRAGFFSPHAIR